ncbi:MAG: pyridoxal-5'-phosphate-dependent protein subunit beta, partial [Acidimicrobiia bacterium]
VGTEHTLDMDETNRNRVFNLGYYTWVEQQGIAIPDFERRRTQDFWDGLRPLTDAWDEMIKDFNA